MLFCNTEPCSLVDEGSGLRDSINPLLLSVKQADTELFLL